MDARPGPGGWAGGRTAWAAVPEPGQRVLLAAKPAILSMLVASTKEGPGAGGVAEAAVVEYEGVDAGFGEGLGVAE